MKLNTLLKGNYLKEIETHFKEYPIRSLATDSRLVKPGSLFVALKGTTTDGIRFVNDAIKNGAKVIASNQRRIKIKDRADICFLPVQDPVQFLRKIAKSFYDNPSQR